MTLDWDVMLVCQNGHVRTDRLGAFPRFMTNYCEICGTRFIHMCQDCGEPIRGAIRGNWTEELFAEMHEVRTKLPRYCDVCSCPYPWQEAAIRNAVEVIELSELSAADSKQLKALLPDLVVETPTTQSSGMKAMRILKNVGEGAREVLVKVVSDIISETAKKQMGI